MDISSIPTQPSEIWKEVKESEGRYYISNFGRVYGVRKKKILKTSINKSGYFTFALQAFVMRLPEGKKPIWGIYGDEPYPRLNLKVDEP